jgi:hypothetical protein
MSDFNLIEGDVTLRNSDGVEIHLKDGDIFPIDITGIQFVGKNGTIARFVVVDTEGRIITAPQSSRIYTQPYSNTSKVEVNHGLGQFPDVRVWEVVRGTAFGAGLAGVGGFGLSGGALPDEVVRLGVGFVLFYLDDDSFTVLFPEHQEGGVVEWVEV